MNLVSFELSSSCQFKLLFHLKTKKISANHVYLNEPPIGLPCINAESLNYKLSGTMVQHLQTPRKTYIAEEK